MTRLTTSAFSSGLTLLFRFDQPIHSDRFWPEGPNGNLAGVDAGAAAPGIKKKKKERVSVKKNVN